MTERIQEVLLQLQNAINNLAFAFARIINNVFTELYKIDYKKKRIGYNAKYWKITDNRHLEIKLMVRAFGSNEHCYYSKIDR